MKIWGIRKNKNQERKVCVGEVGGIESTEKDIWKKIKLIKIKKKYLERLNNTTLFTKNEVVGRVIRTTKLEMGRGYFIVRIYSQSRLEIGDKVYRKMRF